MQCPNCGKPDVSTKFCPGCGAPVVQAPAPPAQPVYTAPAPAQQPATPYAPPQQPEQQEQVTSWYTHDETTYQQNFEQASARHQGQEVELGAKVRRVFNKRDENNPGFVEKIKLFVSDPEQFVERMNPSRDMGTALSIVLGINAFLFVGRMLRAAVFSLTGNPDFTLVVMGALFVLLLPFVSALLCFGAVALLNKGAADWKQIFIIYGYAFTPFALAILPLPFLRLIGLAAFVFLSFQTLKHLLKLEPLPAILYAITPPVILVIVSILIDWQYFVAAFVG